MKRFILPAMAAIIAMPLTLAAQEHDHSKHAAKETQEHKAPVAAPTYEQKTCPIMGGEIDKKIFTEYEGHKVYFCCQACIDKFKEAPMKYLPSLYKQYYPQTVQVKCPIKGGLVDPTLFTEYKGQRVSFCSKDCNAKFKTNPDKYLKMMPELSTEQVHCPVTGNAINPKYSLDFEGKVIYFADEKSIATFKADPKKYMDVLRPDAGLLAYGPTAKDDLLQCPTCASKGKGVHKRSEVDTVDYNGFRYATCGKSCTAKLKADPDKYATILQQTLIERVGDKAKAYTCPMHPQVIRTTATKCPVCGMKLVPATKPAEKL